jgi:hypothetical protein
MPADAPEPAATKVIVERPEAGLAQGQYAWPDWGIALLGTAGVVLGLIALLVRSARTRSTS